MVRYLYALDESGELVNIQDAAKMESKFSCPCCHDEMIRRMGEKREWHFAHKSEKCSYDKYLHTLAERKIMEWWNNGEEITIEFKNQIYCPERDKCQIYPEVKKTSCFYDYQIYDRDVSDEYLCTKMFKEKHNLKQWFSYCEQEKEYITLDGQRFVADLFCPNKKHENNPLFLEICVTHPCSEEKVNSGIKIIEFVIESEKDIDSLIGKPIVEGDKIRFYNFKPKEKPANKTDDVWRPRLSKFIVFPSHKAHVDRKRTFCYNFNQHWGDINITTTDCSILYESAYAFATTINSELKNCSLCKYRKQDLMSGEYICMLYKKYGTNRIATDNDAKTCHYFRKDEERIKQEIAKFQEYKENHFVDIWVKEKEEKQ